MSMFRGHLMGGLVAYLAVVLLCAACKFGNGLDPRGLLAALSGAIFPDIDIYSKGQRLFLKLLALGITLCLLFQAGAPLVLLLFFSLLPIFSRHRGIFHDLVFVFLITVATAGLVLTWLPQYKETVLLLTLFFFAGVLSHLFLDKGVRKTFYL